MPPDWPQPRASQVRTLKPAWRSGPTPIWPNISPSEELLGLVSRDPPQPWPSSTVGARCPGPRLAAGKKEVAIGVPSKEVTVWSRARAAPGDASS